MAILRHLSMFRRTRQHLLVWLLPLLLVQSFVPTGYMLTAGQRGIAIAFCPVQSAATLAVLNGATNAAHAHHGHADHDVGRTPDHSEHARSSSCPFALAGTPLPIATPPSITLVLIPIAISPRIDAATPAGVLLFERNRIRGPPQLA